MAQPAAPNVTPKPPTLVETLPTQDRAGNQETLPSIKQEPNQLGEPRPVGVKSIPGYQILGELGRGGMGVVYKAIQIKLKRTVALKMILSGGYAGKHELERFRVEAEAVARLQHPNIVQIYEIGEQNGLPWFSLEYCGGGSLARMLGGTPLAPKMAAQLLEKLASAVHAAHERGIVHRDLKPANVLLTEDKQPKIADFGLAKRLDSDQGQTVTGAVLGTPSYMAPEQAAGDIKHIGPATDVYALGAILYELLTGRVPFRGSTPMETLELSLKQDPVPPKRLNTTIPVDLETICLKSLEKSAPNRYQSAADLANELRRYLNGEPILARRIGQLRRTIKWAVRKPWAAALLIVSSLAVFFLLAVWSYFAFQLNETSELAQKERDNAHSAKLQAAIAHKVAQERTATEAAARKDADLARKVTGKQSLRAEWINYSKHIEAVQRNINAANDIAAMEHLNQCRWDFRNWEYNYLCAIIAKDNSATATLKHSGLLTPVCIAISFDETLIATASAFDVTLWDTAKARPLHTLKGHTAQLTSISFNNNGTMVATASLDKTIRAWDTRTGTLLATLNHKAPVYSTVFSPDSKFIASGSGVNSDKPSTVTIWDTVTRKRLSSFSDQLGWVTLLAFVTVQPKAAAKTNFAINKGNTHILAGGSEGTVLIDLKRGKVIETMPKNGTPLAISRDCGRLVYVDKNELNTMTLWDINERRDVCIFKGHGATVASVAFGPNGDRIVSAGLDNSVKMWETFSGNEVLTLRQMPAQVPSPLAVCFANKTVAACASDAITIWRPASKLPASMHVKSSLSRGPFPACFSPDGGQIAVVCGMPDSPQVLIFDSSTGKQLCRMYEDVQHIEQAVYSPDGNTIAASVQERVDSNDLQKRRWRIIIWERKSRRVTRRFSTFGQGINDIVFSDNGALIAACTLPERDADNYAVTIWNAKTGGVINRIVERKQTCGAKFCPGGKQVVYATGNSIKLYDIVSHKIVREFNGHTAPVSRLWLSSDGKRMVSWGYDKTYRLWELGSPKESLCLMRETLNVPAAAFSPDGNYILVGGDDLEVWDVATTKRVGTLAEQGGFQITFSPDGKRVLICNVTRSNSDEDFNLRIYPTSDLLGNRARKPIR